MSHHYSGPDFGLPHGGNRMNLPDAPVAREGFFVTHFFTVKDQEQIEGLLCRNSWRESNQSGESLLHQAGQLLDRPQFWWRPDARQARGPARNSSGSQPSGHLPQLASRRHLVLLQTMARQRSALPHRTARKPRLGMALLHARSRRLPYRDWPIHSDGARPLRKVCPLNCRQQV